MTPIPPARRTLPTRLLLGLGLGLAAAALTTVALTQPRASADPQMHAGPAVAIGDGEAWAFVRTDAGGAAEAIGLVLTEAGLDGLPAAMAPMGHETMNMHTLALPAEAAALGLPFDHISLDWNPQGHEPEGLFTVPHFDMHFYMVPEAERMTWVESNPEFAVKGAIEPDPRYLPAGYVSPPDNVPVPYMGLHWVDGADPTYAPGGPAFTEVLLWGSYDGHVIFPEPMITRAFLLGKPDHVETIVLPDAFERPGPYPTRYAVRYDAAARQFVITLEGLTHRPAS